MVNDQNFKSCRQRAEVEMVEVTEANIGEYTLDDVIFPIIGYLVKMPSNPEMWKIVDDIMAEDSITMDMF